MTTNQTIDGVLRELVERARRELLLNEPTIKTLAELRALLDAPAPISSPIGHIEQRRSMGLAIGAPITNVIWGLPHAEPQHLPEGAKVYLHPDVQPQGEPIYQLEYLGEGGGGWNDVDKATYDRFERLPNYRPRIVYAEQPAPTQRSKS